MRPNKCSEEARVQKRDTFLIFAFAVKSGVRFLPARMQRSVKDDEQHAVSWAEQHINCAFIMKQKGVTVSNQTSIIIFFYYYFLDLQTSSSLRRLQRFFIKPKSHI